MSVLYNTYNDINSYVKKVNSMDDIILTAKVRLILNIFSFMFLFILFLLFHIFIIVGIVYFNLNLTNYLWGGQIKTNPELIQFEMISILVQSLCTIIVFFRIRIEKFSKYKKILNLFIWILFLIFLLNTIGNLFANSFYEKIIFT